MALANGFIQTEEQDSNNMSIALKNVEAVANGEYDDCSMCNFISWDVCTYIAPTYGCLGVFYKIT